MSGAEPGAKMAPSDGLHTLRAGDPHPVPGVGASRVKSQGAGGESEVDADHAALSTWLAQYLGNYTLPANYAAPLYGQTHREVAKYTSAPIAEALLESDWLTAYVAARVQQAEAERDALRARVEALADLPYGAPGWGLLSDGVRYVSIPALRAALDGP